MNLRDKIAKIIDLAIFNKSTFQNLTLEDCKYIVDQILNLFSSLDKFEVEENCPELKGCSYIYTNEGCANKCQRTGKIYRPLTLEDIDISDLINHYDYPLYCAVTPTGRRIVKKKK